MIAIPTFRLISAMVFCVISTSLVAEQWSPVTGKKQLTMVISGKTIEANLNESTQSRGTYNPDGNGVVTAWGDRFDRQWKVQGDDQLCFLIRDNWDCYTLEVDQNNPNRYQATHIKFSDRSIIFEVVEDHLVSKSNDKTPSTTPENQGSPGKPSADEIAKKLANPNAPLATLNFKLQHFTYEGNLPNANSQSSTTLLFQPSLPFPLSKPGKSILFRPAIPVFIDRPAYDATQADFDSVTGLSDISFDLTYASTTQNGLLTAIGIISSLPTATKDELGNDQFTLGPEFLIGKLTKSYVVGIFPNHQWDVAGSGDTDVNLTSAQIFLSYLPGGGWNIGSAPILSYDHETNQETIPLNINFGKTVIWSGRPWKLSIEANYYVEKADAIGTDFMIGFSLSPVVENGLAKWFQ